MNQQDQEFEAAVTQLRAGNFKNFFKFCCVIVLTVMMLGIVVSLVDLASNAVKAPTEGE